MRGTCSVSLEAGLNVRAAMEAADLTSRMETGAVFGFGIHIQTWACDVHLLVQRNIFTASVKRERLTRSESQLICLCISDGLVHSHHSIIRKGANAYMVSDDPAKTLRYSRFNSDFSV